MKLEPTWWCPECESPRYGFDNCSCGREYELTWKCRCGKVNIGFACECGFDMGKGVRNRKLSRLLSGRVGSTNQTVLQRLEKFVFFTAYKNRIPDSVAEEAWSKTLENIVIGIDSYNQDKGEFMHWAFAVARNTLMSVSRQSVTENEKLGPSLDYESADGELLAETIGSDESPLNVLLEDEGRRERLAAMVGIAVSSMGTYTTEGGEGSVKKKLFHACVDAYAERGHGWIGLVAYRTGLSSRIVSLRKDKAKEALLRWQERTRM